MMHPEWWWWAVGGLALILAELVVPAFVLIWFGLGGLIVAATLFVAADLDLTAQLFIWLLVSLALLVFWFRIFNPRRLKTRIGMSQSSLVGEVGMLTRDVAIFEKGEVRFQKPMLGTDVWPCIADMQIKSGERVRVLAVEGSLLKVSKL
jgi:membrane protein implicated in regulation of membrane protease activity